MPCDRALGASGGWVMAWSVNRSDLPPACSLVLPSRVFPWDLSLCLSCTSPGADEAEEGREGG